MYSFAIFPLLLTAFIILRNVISIDAVLGRFYPWVVILLNASVHLFFFIDWLINKSKVWPDNDYSMHWRRIDVIGKLLNHNENMFAIFLTFEFKFHIVYLKMSNSTIYRVIAIQLHRRRRRLNCVQLAIAGFRPCNACFVAVEFFTSNHRKRHENIYD